VQAFDSDERVLLSTHRLKEIEMIWDSGPWRDELLKSATKLEQMAVRRKPSSKLIVELEKAVFFAAYIVRKLMEARLLSSEYPPITARAYPAKGKPATLWNWHHIDDLYDLAGPMDKTITLRELCNQLVHCYVFMPLTSSKTGPVKAVVFTSDHNRNNALYEVSLATISNVLRTVARDYPSHSEWKLNSKTRDYQVRNWTPAQ